MTDDLNFLTGNCTENSAEVLLQPRRAAAGVEITGCVRGPFSAVSKTLTADFPLRPRPDFAAAAVGSQVIDPCYWTPALPFEYELRLTHTQAAGQPLETIQRTGFKRWHADGANLRLQLKRIVLRGLRCDSPAADQLSAAREHETALVVSDPSPEICATASRLGVLLIADLRTASQPWPEACATLDWFPAVVVVLRSAEQLTQSAARPRQSLTAACLTAETTADEMAAVPCDLFAVELSPGERPPTWLATPPKPVIALARAQQFPLETARSGCDQWQAALAPQFDLAGYLV